MARWLLKRWMFPGWYVVAVPLAFVMAIPASAMPNIQCTLATSVQEVHSLSQLPPELGKLLSPIADIGAPWNETDSVSDPTLPFKRLVRAGYRGSDWFVWYEHGGVGYSLQAVFTRVMVSGEITLLANAEVYPGAAPVSNTLCTLTDGVFAGQVPPYPPGTWATTGY